MWIQRAGRLLIIAAALFCGNYVKACGYRTTLVRAFLWDQEIDRWYEQERIYCPRCQKLEEESKDGYVNSGDTPGEPGFDPTQDYGEFVTTKTTTLLGLTIFDYKHKSYWMSYRDGSGFVNVGSLGSVDVRAMGKILYSFAITNNPVTLFGKQGAVTSSSLTVTESWSTPFGGQTTSTSYNQNHFVGPSGGKEIN